MTTKQLKAEISKALDNVSEEMLVDVLKYLTALQGKSDAEMLRAKRIRRMLVEDKDLLTKLAQ